MPDAFETGSVLKTRRAWLAYSLASIGPLVTWILLVLLAPKFGSRHDSTEVLDQVLNGGLIGIALAFALSFAVAAWIHHCALRGGFMLPLAMGFLAKLFGLAGGTLLLWGPFAHVGRPEAFALCFAVTAFTFQLTFLPLLEKSLHPKSDPT